MPVFWTRASHARPAPSSGAAAAAPVCSPSPQMSSAPANAACAPSRKNFERIKSPPWKFSEVFTRGPATSPTNRAVESGANRMSVGERVKDWGAMERTPCRRRPPATADEHGPTRSLGARGSSKPRDRAVATDGQGTGCSPDLRLHNGETAFGVVGTPPAQDCEGPYIRTYKLPLAQRLQTKGLRALMSREVDRLSKTVTT